MSEIKPMVNWGLKGLAFVAQFSDEYIEASWGRPITEAERYEIEKARGL